MSIQKSLLLTAVAALALVVGCKHSEPVVIEVTPPDPWQWQPPTPPPPRMAWVAAGAYRKEERTPATVNAIVIHTTESAWKDDLSHVDNQNRAFANVIRYFVKNDRNVSAHFVMGPNGEICNMVNEADVAATQTYYNPNGIGIECAGWARRPETWTPEMMDSLVDLCAYLCVKWEVPAYQSEGTAYEGPNSTMTPEGEYRFTGQGLVGHYQVQPWNKTDPGAHFQWEEFCERVRAKIREYGIEPIALPPSRPDLPEGTTVTGTIEGDILPNVPFVYRLIVEGPGVGSLAEDAVRFTDYTKIRNLTVTDPPTRKESTDTRLVYEVTLTPGETRSITLIPPKVRIGEHWYDPGTIRIEPRQPEVTEQPQQETMTQ